ncbi:MAG: hypothetical protein ACFFCW_42120 [Candidatus Hodarchaeota archaeon]
MNFIKQVYITSPIKGDILTYRCEKCGNVVEKFIEHPPEYTKLLKDLATKSINECKLSNALGRARKQQKKLKNPSSSA